MVRPYRQEQKEQHPHVGLGESEAPGGCPGRDAQNTVGHVDLPMRGEAMAGAQTQGSAAARCLLKLTGGES